jgi:tetratricopeptide (TPR) repeat protein
MSFKEVKELRTNGRLDEALIMAQADLEADSSNVWNIRSISWVYYEFAKKNSNVNGYDTFINYFDKTIALELEESDAKMLHENFAIQLGKLVYDIFKVKELDVEKVNTLFEKSKQLLISKPSDANSFLIKAFLKGNKIWKNLDRIFDHFGFDSFQDKDYKSEEFNGKAILSTVEKYYNAYSKYLIDMSKDGFTSPGVSQHFMMEFMPKLDSMIVSHPEYQFLPYFKAKMLIFLNRKDEVLETFLPFAKRKKSEFWVWEVLAETFDKSDENCFACYCKALSLKSPQEFLIGIRKDFADILIAKGLYSEAKLEIEKIVEIRNAQGWKTPNEILSITNKPWYSQTTAKSSNVDLYNQYASKAEELLFQSVEEEIIVVEFVNHDKQMMNFIKDKVKHGFFSYKGLIQKPKVGDVLRVRFNGDGSDGFFKALSLNAAKHDDQSDAFKSFEGIIRIKEGSDFGFVGDIFIEPTILKRNNFSNNQEISGKAILSFNKKKNQWGWKMV